MPKRGRKDSDSSAETLETLKDLLIVELARAGVPQQQIQKIVGCDIVRVSRIAKHIKVKR
jgi:hypothetical protein